MFMLNYLKEETNYAYTENGALSRATTGSSLLDFFAQAGAMRKRSEQDIINAFTEAFSEDKLLALKALFYFRDIREGQGERRLFRVIAKYLANFHTDVMEKNLHLIPEYGRWDDLYVFFGTKLEDKVGQLIKEQFEKDIKSEYPSLLGKWLKSENTSSQESRVLAKMTRKILGLSPRQYRKALTSLRKKIDIVEAKMSANEWNEIKFEHVPSQAMLKYRNAFNRHEPKRYQEYLISLSKGETKVNTKTLYPYQLVNKVGIGYLRFKNLSIEEEQLLNEMWNNLPDYIGNKKENSIAVVDTSGSMYGTPLEVAISLGLYMAERNKGKFHNHFITFSERPQLQEIKGVTFCEKVRNMAKADWGMSTNIESVFNLILNTAIKHNLPQEEMIKKIYIISDMEFNYCVDGGNDKTLFENIREKYNRYGYELPKLVFWNVDARNKQFPVTMNDTGVQLVSGFSPTLFEQVMSGKEAYDLMLDTLNSPRYDAITI
jgi:Domain of unknown function (DUF2828)